LSAGAGRGPENDRLVSSGGVTTPSVAMGQALLDRLRRAGLTFEVAG